MTGHILTDKDGIFTDYVTFRQGFGIYCCVLEKGRTHNRFKPCLSMRTNIPCGRNSSHILDGFG